MSKIDKIIQIVRDGHDTLVGLSESGRMYKYNAGFTNHYGGNSKEPDWTVLIESPVVDNSAELEAERKSIKAQSDHRKDIARLSLGFPK